MRSYFTVEELIKSDVALKFGIPNVPDEVTKKNLERLIKELLDPIRKAWGSSVIVTSGYRCPEVNALVGGALKSAHKYGLAADIIPGNGKRREFINFVQNFLRKGNVGFDQCIDEYGRWCHVGLEQPETGKRRREIFRIG